MARILSIAILAFAILAAALAESGTAKEKEKVKNFEAKEIGRAHV